LLTNFETSSEQLGRLNGISMHCSLSGPILTNGGEVQMMASMYVHDGTLPWIKRLFSIVTAIQVTEAQIFGEGLSGLISGRAAVTAHPVSGRREQMDDMLTVIEKLIAPEGRKPSPWVTELEPVYELLQNSGYDPVLEDDGIQFVFPFAHSSALVSLSTAQVHPRLGNGLLILTTLPTLRDISVNYQLPLNLNFLELRSVTRSHFLGSWCLSPELLLTHVSFFPNIAYQPNSTCNLVMSACQRLRWLEEWITRDQSGDGSIKTDKPDVCLPDHLEDVAVLAELDCEATNQELPVQDPRSEPRTTHQPMTISVWGADMDSARTVAAGIQAILDEEHSDASIVSGIAVPELLFEWGVTKLPATEVNDKIVWQGGIPPRDEILGWLRWPQTVVDAVDRLLEDPDMATIDFADELSLHFLGMGIRNSFGLWGANKRLLESCGSEGMTADDASGVILLTSCSQLAPWKQSNSVVVKKNNKRLRSATPTKKPPCGGCRFQSGW
jgi:hypothetical protein